MLEFWPSVKELLLNLVRKSQHIDKDGMDLKFTCSKSDFRPSNKPSDFQKEMEKPTHQPMSGEFPRQTRMDVTLGHLLKQYVSKYERSRAATRKMTIIVLTDGIWDATKDKFAVDQEIIQFNVELGRLGGNSLEDDERRVSIQFVRFGENPVAKRRLERLDNQLKFKGVQYV